MLIMLGVDRLLAIMVPLGFSLCVYIHSSSSASTAGLYV